MADYKYSPTRKTKRNLEASLITPDVKNRKKKPRSESDEDDIDEQEANRDVHKELEHAHAAWLKNDGSGGNVDHDDDDDDDDSEPYSSSEYDSQCSSGSNDDDDQDEEPDGDDEEEGEQLGEQGEEGDEQESDTLMGFGKHSQRTFRQVLDCDPGYYNWGKRQSDPNPQLKRFLDWVDGQPNYHRRSTPSLIPVRVSSTRTVNENTRFTFGKHRGMTYIQVVTEDPTYVRWARSQPYPTRQLRDFVEWTERSNVALILDCYYYDDYYRF